MRSGSSSACLAGAQPGRRAGRRAAAAAADAPADDEGGPSPSTSGSPVGPTAAGRPGSARFPAGSGAASFGGPAAGAATSSGGRAAELRRQLAEYGLAGVLAYGLLNTAYYTCMFLFVWLYVAKVPQGLGLQGAARKFVEVFALTWGGSQVTKVARAAGALALAPLADRLLTWVQARFPRVGGRRGAFGAVVGGCVAVALLLFAGVVGSYA